MSNVHEEKENAPQEAASDKEQPSSNMFEGQVADTQGKENFHTSEKDAQLSNDGTIYKARDLLA